MEKLSFYDINKIFEELNDRKSSDFEMDMLLDLEITNLTKLKYEVDSSFHLLLDTLGEFEIVQTDYSDRDGYDTEQIFRVLYFTDHDVYVKVKGYWSSFGGDNFESMKEVKPTQKTITVYE
jgi:hypothetical protein